MQVRVCELDWLQPEQARAYGAPADFVLAADCVYSETIVPHFHRTIMDVTSEKSVVGGAES